jgi:hypothetical protein
MWIEQNSFKGLFSIISPNQYFSIPYRHKKAPPIGSALNTMKP